MAVKDAPAKPAAEKKEAHELAVSSGVPEIVRRRGIDESQWRTLALSLYPGAKAESVLMVIDYCRARHLDPLKKPCHIVPMEVRKAGSNTFEWRDVVLPGIYEVRTTAHRTGLYLGHSEPLYGPIIEYRGAAAPEWCKYTVFRWNERAHEKIAFPVQTFFREVVATKADGKANARWQRAPIQMLTKCAEAAALREAFPDELGGELTAEEMDGQRAADVEIVATPARPKPEGYDNWLTDMLAASDGGDAIAEAWQQSPQSHREYLADTDPAMFDALKAKA